MYSVYWMGAGYSCCLSFNCPVSILLKVSKVSAGGVGTRVMGRTLGEELLWENLLQNQVFYASTFYFVKLRVCSLFTILTENIFRCLSKALDKMLFFNPKALIFFLFLQENIC